MRGDDPGAERLQGAGEVRAVKDTRNEAEYRRSLHYYDDHLTGAVGTVGAGRDSGGSVEADTVLYSPSGDIVFCSRRRQVGFAKDLPKKVIR